MLNISVQSIKTDIILSEISSVFLKKMHYFNAGSSRVLVGTPFCDLWKPWLNSIAHYVPLLCLNLILKNDIFSNAYSNCIAFYLEIQSSGCVSRVKIVWLLDISFECSHQSDNNVITNVWTRVKCELELGSDVSENRKWCEMIWNDNQLTNHFLNIIWLHSQSEWPLVWYLRTKNKKLNKKRMK